MCFNYSPVLFVASTSYIFPDSSSFVTPVREQVFPEILKVLIAAGGIILFALVVRSLSNK